MPLNSFHNKKELESHRKLQRNASTSAVATLWLLLKGKQLKGRKFRRQHSPGNYIVDFYCPSERLAIELDGEPHFTNEGIAHDEIRIRFIAALNVRIIEFENCRVFENPPAILIEIERNFR